MNDRFAGQTGGGLLGNDAHVATRGMNERADAYTPTSIKLITSSATSIPLYGGELIERIRQRLRYQSYRSIRREAKLTVSATVAL